MPDNLYSMKKLILLILSSTLLWSCRDGEDGPPGPDGISGLKIEGTNAGTMYFNYPNGDTAIVPYTYPSFLSAIDQTYYIDTVGNNSTYHVTIRRNDVSDPDNYMDIYFCDAFYDAGNDTTFSVPSSALIYFNYIKANGTLFKLNNYYNESYYVTGQNLKIRNYYLNPTTGRLTFTYELTVPYGDISYDVRPPESIPAILKGTIDVQLNRSLYDNSYCGNNPQEEVVFE